MSESIFAEMKADRKKAEMYLLAYEEKKREYERKKSEYLNPPKEEQNKEGTSYGISKPTEQQAIKSAEYDMNDEYCWLRAVELVVCHTTEAKRQVLQARRRFYRLRRRGDGKKAWVIYVRTHIEIDLSERAIQNCWYKLVEDVKEVFLRELIKYRIAKEGVLNGKIEDRVSATEGYGGQHRARIYRKHKTADDCRGYSLFA